MTDQQAEPVEAGVTLEGTTSSEDVEPGQSRQERRDAHVREQLKAVEAERDRLREQLDARDRAFVDTEAVRVLGAKGAALFRYEITDLRDESGHVDPVKVDDALKPLAEALAEGRQVHHGDMGPRTSAPAGRATWGQLIRGGGGS